MFEGWLAGVGPGVLRHHGRADCDWLVVKVVSPLTASRHTLSLPREAGGGVGIFIYADTALIFAATQL